MTGIGEAVVASALGWAVEELLNEVVKAFKRVKYASSNVRKLRDLLERLEPSIKILSSVQDANHPAGKWLTDLRVQLERARDLANAFTRITDVFSACVRVVKLYRASKKAVELCDCIRDLLTEASTLQWASQLAFFRILNENDQKILDFCAVRGKDEDLFREIANLATKEEIQRGFAKLEQAFDSENLHGSSASVAMGETSGASSACDVPELKVHFGGDAIAADICRHILEGRHHKWVGLWGMGGIGKTFTASKIYRDSEIQRYFAGRVYWVTVSKDQPDTFQLCKTLIEKVGASASTSQMPRSLEAAKFYLAKLLHRKRVLLILDDVWEDEDGDDVLQHFDLVSEDEKSVILVTTRDKDILGRVGTCKIFEIPILSEKDSWRLFSWHAFQLRGRNISPDLEAVAKDVAKECGGLPLALEVIGSTMADRELSTDQRALGLSSLHIWQSALTHLKNASHGRNEYKRLFRRLQMSVDSLQDSRLKDCFFYFAAFAEDSLVFVDDLVRIWIADGLVENDVNTSFSGEVEGRLLFSCLLAKSMIHMNTHSLWDQSEHVCNVHDVMRDVAQRNLKANLTTGEEIPASARECLYAPGLELSTLPKDWTKSGAEFKAKRLSMISNRLENFPGLEPFHARDLRVLILSGSDTSLHALPAGFLGEFSSLRVLDLSLSFIEEIPDGVLRGLPSLVLLDLKMCVSLRKVSDEVNGLRNLEYLSLLHCDSLIELPRVDKLTQLKRFAASVPFVNKVIGKVAQLRCLTATVPSLALDHEDVRMDNNKDTNIKMKENDENVQLQEGESDGGPQQEQGKANACDHLTFVIPTCVRNLCLAGLYNDVGFRLDVSSLSALETMIFSGKCSPVGVADQHHLRYLDWNDYSETSVPPLCRLAKLEHLNIILRTDLGTESYGQKGAFPCLKTLYMYCTNTLQKMFIFHPGTMPKIENLYMKMRDEIHIPPSIRDTYTSFDNPVTELKEVVFTL